MENERTINYSQSITQRLDCLDKSYAHLAKDFSDLKANQAELKSEFRINHVDLKAEFKASQEATNFLILTKFNEIQKNFKK